MKVIRFNYWFLQPNLNEKPEPVCQDGIWLSPLAVCGGLDPSVF